MVNKILAGLLFLAAFVVVTVLVITGLSQAFDTWLVLAINHAYLGPQLSSLLVIASEYGREYFWIPIVAVMLIFGKRDMKTLAIELAVLFVVGIIVGEAMKFAMYRPRPFDTLSGITTRVPMSTDSSYPSGHALIVSIGAIFALSAFVRSRRGRAVAGLLALEAALVMYSRVYVGVHYPLDVLGGLFLAGAIVFIGMYFLRGPLRRAVERLSEFADRLLGRLHVPAVL